MIKTIQIEETFEMTKGLEKYPKIIRVSIDEESVLNLSDNYLDQSYYHWSILNNYVPKHLIEKIKENLMKLILKSNEESITKDDIRFEINENLKFLYNNS